MIKADNAVMIVAGTSSRFAPLSYERPKGLTRVRGEVLIERQSAQLRAAGIRDNAHRVSWADPHTVPDGPDCALNRTHMTFLLFSLLGLTSPSPDI